MSGKKGVGATFAELAVLLSVAGSAYAHPGPGVSVEHTPFDHVLAMLALGLWAVVLGGAAVYFAARLSRRLVKQEKRRDLNS